MVTALQKITEHMSANLWTCKTNYSEGTKKSKDRNEI